MFNFTPLLGAQCDSPASQSILELDGGVKILIDVGWDESFDAEKLKALEAHIPTLSLILLTHPTLSHLGAYAHLCKHFPLFVRIPTYATIPVVNLGRTLLTDVYASSPLAASVLRRPQPSPAGSSQRDGSPNILLQPPTADEIAAYFAHINPLKYSQPHQPLPSPFSAPLAGLTITAYSAGHTLGGTIWHLQHGLESIVYATDWNQAKESLFPGAAFLTPRGGEVIEQLSRPSALICSTKGAERASAAGGRRKRDETLVQLVRETIAQGGKVLIPTDSSARVLELAYLLNETWRENVSGPHADTYRSARIYLGSKSAGTTMRYMQSMVEWMNDDMAADVEAAMTKGNSGGGPANPLEFRHVRVLEKTRSVQKAAGGSKPCVLLASDSSLEWGYSRAVFKALASDSKNLVILTERAARLEHDGLAHQLQDVYEQRSKGSDAAQIIRLDNTTLHLRNTTTHPLSADDTLLYQTHLARHRQQHSTPQGDNTLTADSAADTADDDHRSTSADSSSSSDAEDAEHQGKTLNLSSTLTAAKRAKTGLPHESLGSDILLRGARVHDYDVRAKRGREKLFPFTARRARADDFGEVIRPEMYVRAEERGGEGEGADAAGGRLEDVALGTKRKWGDADAGRGRGSGSGASGGKRARTGRDAIDAAIAAATGESLDGKEGGSEEEVGESEGEDDGAGPVGPLKVVFAHEAIEVKVRVALVDFAGLHEKRDLQMLLPLIRPRKVILVGGMRAETLALAGECGRLLEGVAVLAPGVGETVEASVDTNAWTLRLSRRLVKGLTWQNVRGLGVVALTGRLEAAPALSAAAGEDDGVEEDGEGGRKKMKLAAAGVDDGNDAPATNGRMDNGTRRAEAAPALLPVLDLLSSAPNTTPTTSNTTAAPHLPPIHVGDLRLADLRKSLTAAGHSAEFRGEGTLLVDGAVVVRKSGAGRFELEGRPGYAAADAPVRFRRLGRAFEDVKGRIYEGLAVVAGV